MAPTGGTPAHRPASQASHYAHMLQAQLTQTRRAGEGLCVCSEAQAGKAEPFPVTLLNHRSMNEIKFTLRGFPGYRGFTPGCSITEIKTNSLPGPRRAAPRRSF